MLDQGFRVKAVDLGQEYLDYGKEYLKDYDQSRVEWVCGNFMDMSEENRYDLVVAWKVIYGGNKKIGDMSQKIRKIYNMLKKGGQFVANFKSDEDSWRTDGVLNEFGFRDTPFIDNPNTAYGGGYMFYTQSGLVDTLSECGFRINYLEKSTWFHTLDRDAITTNEMWRDAKLEVRDDYFVVCATKE